VQHELGPFLNTVTVELFDSFSSLTLLCNIDRICEEKRLKAVFGFVGGGGADREVEDTLVLLVGLAVTRTPCEAVVSEAAVSEAVVSEASHRGKGCFS
jgi:hypothetical protein